MPWTAPNGTSYIFPWEDEAAGGTPLSAANLRADAADLQGFVVAVANSLDTYLETLISGQLVSPALTGTPTAPTATQNDNSTKISNTAYADRAATAVRGLAIGYSNVPAATRYVGATTGGAPTTAPTGGYLSGDWIWDTGNKTLWLCTTGGSPGTWLNVLSTAAARVPNVLSVTSSATPSVDCGTYDELHVTALATPITAITITGSPADSQTMIMEFTDNGTPQGITWSGTTFAAMTNAALPTTTTTSKTTVVCLKYSTTKTKWISWATDTF